MPRRGAGGGLSPFADAGPLARPDPGRRPRGWWRPFVWRGLAFAAVYAAGLAGFLSGVGVTERSLVDAGVWERAYYTLGLFVLGGMDLGTPVGGPDFGRGLLWVAFFAAPVITASAIVEAVIRLVAPLTLRVRPLRNHVVLGGAGRLTLLYLARLRERDPRCTAVVVERDPSHPALNAVRELYGGVVIVGDITRDETLARVRLDRARRVLFLTGDDFANLDAAAKALRVAPGLDGRIVVHVSNLGFMRDASGSRVAQACELFNGHEFAAVKLVQERLLGRFHETPFRDLVVLAGFGRFGQTVLDQLQQGAAGRFDHVVIIDQNATRNARSFADLVGFDGAYERSVIDGDLIDPAVWQRVGAITADHGHDPVVILGSGDDGTNLHAAVRIRRQHPGAYVIVRSFGASPFTAEIAEESGVHAFDLAGLIENGMPDAWF